MGLFSKTCGTARALYPASCTNNTVVNVFAPAPNPNPKRFDIVHLEQIGHCVVATINYLDCTNFEGLKVIWWPVLISGFDLNYKGQGDRPHPLTSYSRYPFTGFPVTTAFYSHHPCRVGLCISLHTHQWVMAPRPFTGYVFNAGRDKKSSPTYTHVQPINHYSAALSRIIAKDSPLSCQTNPVADGDSACE